MASYRWYKYKVAFSAPLVGYLISRYGIESGKVLDPFASAGGTESYVDRSIDFILADLCRIANSEIAAFGGHDCAR